jgi:hypothetical protein
LAYAEEYLYTPVDTRSEVLGVIGTAWSPPSVGEEGEEVEESAARAGPLPKEVPLPPGDPDGGPPVVACASDEGAVESLQATPSSAAVRRVAARAARVWKRLRDMGHLEQ